MTKPKAKPKPTAKEQYWIDWENTVDKYGK